MRDTDAPANARAEEKTWSPAAAPLLAVFGSALFLSALLLFAVQPMFAKMVLPRLGGSPAVWSVAMCFFQVTLLAGYAYAHWLNRHLRTPIGVIAHLGVLMLAILLLPLGVASGWERPPADGVHIWVLGLFAVSIGLPFFALAGNAPLLQAWFSRTGHRHAQDPYFLYGASNLGSLLALLGYPFLIEPNATLEVQSAVWSLGYKVLIVVVGLSGLLMLAARTPRTDAAPAGGGEYDTHPASAGESGGLSSLAERLTWMGLAFVPSGLLVAVTSHITTDVAAVPLLWVLPLALFLLTYVITFQRRPVLPQWLMLAVQPAMIVALIITMQFPVKGYWPLLVGLHLATFFVCAMVCHGELVRRRPPARELTQFYLCMSAGGAAGGLFTGLIAPYVFSTVLEYPLLLVLALTARPGFRQAAQDPRQLAREGAIAAGLLALAIGPKVLAGIEVVTEIPRYFIVVLAVFAAAIILARPHALRLTALVAAALLTGHVLTSERMKGESLRGFFGVNKVIDTPDGAYRLLFHGTTLHGAQRIKNGNPDNPEPLTYFHREGPFGDVIESARRDRPLERVAVVGLGTGSLACYKRPDETWRFFEIDPIVVRLATDPARFTFLSGCAPDADIVIGDARLTLEDEPAGRYDLLIVDAFSSDSIPIHLLTREALRMYMSRLAEGGILALHLSNRNLDLRPVVSAVAADLGLSALSRSGGAVGNVKESFKSRATVAALAENAGALDVLRERKGWAPLAPSGTRVWTDDYSNILGPMLSAMGEPTREEPGSEQ